MAAMTTSTIDLADRYVALWNEPDPDRRRIMVRELWRADAVQVLDPPEEIRERAAELGFPQAALEARGHAALEVRIARAYESFVAPGEFVFRRRGEAARVGDVLTLCWDMAPVGGGEPAGGGREFLALDAEGRIRSDHQFIDR
jgi:hypothetical protein